MTTMPHPIRALGLLSGGLDSALAARLMLDQGIEVVGLHLESPTACRGGVRELAAELGIRLEVRDKGREFLRLIRDPRHGHGKNMNPCVDCRIFMFQLARPFLQEFGAHFVFTGEVLGQRPMSQTARAMELIDRKAGLDGLLLRPLSALRLSETEPERRGWVDRSRLLGLSGRSRETQLMLAARYGLRAHGSPGGGCLLTDPAYSKRLKALFDRVGDDVMDERDVELLSYGRHVAVRPDLVLIVGRDSRENDALRSAVGGRRWLVEPDGFKGPVVLADGPRDPGAEGLALGALAAYSPGDMTGRDALLRHAHGEERRALGGPPDAAGTEESRDRHEFRQTARR
jgi:tRNA-specific 2-thiouridylase